MARKCHQKNLLRSGVFTHFSKGKYLKKISKNFERRVHHTKTIYIGIKEFFFFSPDVFRVYYRRPRPVSLLEDRR